MIKQIKRKVLSAVSVLAALTLLFGMTAIADGNVVTIGDFTYERTTETVGGREVDAWSVVEYHGSDSAAVIPDAIDASGSTEILDVVSADLQANLSAGNMVTEVSSSAFSGSDVEQVRLPGYLMKANSDLFGEALELKEITGAGKVSANGFKTDGTALYKGTTLMVFPKGYTDSYEVMDGTTKYTSSVFANCSFEKLTLTGDVTYGSENSYGRSLFVNSSIGEVDIDNATVDEKTFLGANIGIFSGSNTESGSIVKNNELLYYGFDSDFDFSSITSISSVAFQTEALYKSVESSIPDSIKESTVFRFYNGTGSEYTQRYFNINGRTAFCYDYGKDNPEIVGDLLEYDTTIEPNTERYNQVRALLYGGVPNNADGLFAEIFGDDYEESSYDFSGDAAKNAVGALVWEVVSGQDVNIDGIYGISSNNFSKSDVKKYINALRTRYIEKADSFDLSDFELGFYQPKQPSSAQRLVVINEIYRPDPVEPTKPSVTISKKDMTTSKELPGAILKIVKDNVVIEQWTSTTTPHVISDLEDGEYVLIEITAPNGYLIAESITFTVFDGKVSTANIVMYDAPEDNEDLYISKRDLTTDEELPGATLKVTKDGELIAQWTSTSKPHKLTNLEDGEYILTEIIAPNGYEIASDITFTIKDGKSDNSPVVMYDDVSPTATSSDAKPSKPGSNGGYSGGSSDNSSETTKTPVTEIDPTQQSIEEPRTELPVTGDIGGVVKIMIGALLTLAFGYAVKKKINFKF